MPFQEPHLVLPASTAFKLPVVHFIHSAMTKEQGLGCKELHRELSPGVKMSIKVWMSCIQSILTLLKNSFYQSPSQTQTEDCLLKNKSKVLPWTTTVPAVTDLPQGHFWIIMNTHDLKVPRRKRHIVCAIDCRPKGTNLLSYKPWKKHFPFFSLNACFQVILLLLLNKFSVVISQAQFLWRLIFFPQSLLCVHNIGLIKIRMNRKT